MWQLPAFRGYGAPTAEPALVNTKAPVYYELTPQTQLIQLIVDSFTRALPKICHFRRRPQSHIVRVVVPYPMQIDKTNDEQ